MLLRRQWKRLEVQEKVIYKRNLRESEEFVRYSSVSLRPKSLSCLSLTTEGERVIRLNELVVLGKGMTSRMESSPAKSITIRSNPCAIPP